MALQMSEAQKSGLSGVPAARIMCPLKSNGWDSFMGNSWFPTLRNACSVIAYQYSNL